MLICYSFVKMCLKSWKLASKSWSDLETEISRSLNTPLLCTTNSPRGTLHYEYM